MGLLRLAGYPAHRAAGRWVFDVLVALAAAASAVPAVIHTDGRPQTLVIVVLALGAAPLLVRRIWSLPVFGLVVAVNLAAGLAVHGHALNGAALLIALYTVAAMRPRRDACTCAGLLEVTVVTGLLLFAGGGWWFDAIFASGMVAAALGLGLYSATRRAYLAELHDRAERLERERDQQGALATAAERTRIAREMHDIVAHNLTVMVTLSEAAIATSAASPERATDLMRKVSATGRRALADTRRLLGVLRPGQDPDEDLQPVPGLAQLDTLIEQVRSAGLDTTLEIRGAAPDVPAGLQLTAYRLVQEALTNTLKHGGTGARASVRLRFQPGELRVDIDDDGAGDTAPVTASIGSGLIGMQERVHAYGGDVQAGPRSGGGWKVSAQLHLDGGDAA
ncbi:MAG: sensor histidine kinase [Streptosporangiaceae bacterium]|jgi:signal transduction histidine kinase